MADFTRVPERFFFTGISCFPADALPAGKYPYVKNVRVYADGEMRPRDGLNIRQTVAGDVHTLARLNDPTTFNGGVPTARIVGADDRLYRGIISNAGPPQIDSGYSGDPLTTLSAQPPQSPRPWEYIADSDRYRKFTTDGAVYEVGIAQPSAPMTEPGVAIQPLRKSSNDIQTSTAWVPAGTAASGTSLGDRVNTTISQILYDVGVTGYCSIVPANPINITVGTLLTVGNPAGSFDNEIVTEITIPIANTTVAAIIYDVGNTGLCTIEPAGSLGVGQLDAPSIDAYRRRAFKQQGIAYAVPRGQGGYLPVLESDQPTKRIRQVDFPVNCLIQLGAELVRILSVAVGPDGKQSFRCRTATTIVATDTIVGLPAFRMFLPSTRVAGEGILRTFVANTLTYSAPVVAGTTAQMTAGIQSVYAINLSQFSNGEAVLPDDELHLAVNISRLAEIKTIRVYIDVDAVTNDFLQNYYFHEWRESDISASVQAINAQNVAPLSDSRKTVVTNQQLDQIEQRAQANALIFGEPIEEARRRARASIIGDISGAGRTRRQPVATSAVSTQMALGNNQWIDLRVKIGQLQHVGTDPTRTLANAKAFEILLSCEAPQPDTTPSPIDVQYSDLQIYGGGGPDVGEVGDPYVYTYRYRSSQTGAVSNPAPQSRGGVIPRRQNVELTPTASTDPQVDKIDWFRLGGALPVYTYVGTGPNTAAVFTDDRMDSAIDGGEGLSYDNFQPWPLQDLPRTGTCNVAGTAIEWVSGDTFDTRWAAGSVILVNGRATTLYASPSSTTILHVVDSVGSGAAVEFTLPGPTIMSQPLRSVWGMYQGLYFACGDQINPGTLYYSNGNNIEAATDSNSVIATTPSEPLMAGGVYNTFPFVASSDDLYGILVNFNDAITPVRAIRTPCGRGFWTPWAWTIAPEGIYFLAADGIALTLGGSPADLITSPDLRNIFPKDGLPGTTTNGIPAPDMTDRTHLRLSYIAGWLYFDYVDANGDGWTLIYDTQGKRFFLDSSDYADLRVRLEEPGAGVYNQIIGAANGEVLQYDENAQDDVNVGIPYAIFTRWTDGGDPRVIKQFGDIGLNANPGGSLAGITVQPIVQDGTLLPPPTVIGAGAIARQNFIIGLPGGQQLANNLGIQITGTLTGADPARPQFFWWEPTYVPKAEEIATRATDADDLGYQGAKFIQGILIRANTYGVNKPVEVQRATVSGWQTMLTLTINHNGESTIAYPLAAAGWDPFIGELVRLRPTGNAPWQYLGARWIWEPAPETATQWETQFTSAEWPGYGTVRDMVFAYEATQPFILLFTYDDKTQTYIIPASNGQYRRYYFPFCPNKAKAVKFQWKTSEPGRIYKRDCSVRTQGWGNPSGYAVQGLFGGPSRESGAQI